MMGEDLGACLKNHQMLDAVQECLMMKPELVVQSQSFRLWEFGCQVDSLPGDSKGC